MPADLGAEPAHGGAGLAATPLQKSATSRPSAKRRRGGARKCLARGAAIGARQAGRISTRPAAAGGVRGAGYAPLRCDGLCAPSLPSTLVGTWPSNAKATPPTGRAALLAYGTSTPRLVPDPVDCGRGVLARRRGMALDRIREPAGQAEVR